MPKYNNILNLPDFAFYLPLDFGICGLTGAIGCVLDVVACEPGALQFVFEA
ncbi:MAG TPA: hypothetical protein VMW10_11810 [Alphaproteobacteria bacterium]|nr:hypothetical protein [Alphaproteobacteria bacterium]